MNERGDSSLQGYHRAVRVPIRRPVRVVDLLTGAMVLAMAGLAMLGPVIAGVLIYRNGAAPEGTAVTASLVLAVIAVAVTLVAAAAMGAVAWRRMRRRRPPIVERPRRQPYPQGYGRVATRTAGA
ncbi:hypothetical protein ACFVMC_12500 [Nocardia sp. NPDC127579]|uniref:hypothetical protein n=1 Tax=Nocardia sp. NPDC127579 TaxID=3345402 RepID=UPI0036434038